MNQHDDNLCQHAFTQVTARRQTPLAINVPALPIENTSIATYKRAHTPRRNLRNTYINNRPNVRIHQSTMAMVSDAMQLYANLVLSWQQQHILLECSRSCQQHLMLTSQHAVVHALQAEAQYMELLALSRVQRTRSAN